MSEPMTDKQLKDLEFFASQHTDCEGVCFACTLTSCLKEIARLKDVLKESNTVCICGCPMDEHENYGEDGMGCGHDDHECIPTSRAALSIVQDAMHHLDTNPRLVEENNRLKEENRRLKDEEAGTDAAFREQNQRLTKSILERDKLEEENRKLRELLGEAKYWVQKQSLSKQIIVCLNREESSPADYGDGESGI